MWTEQRTIPILAAALLAFLPVATLPAQDADGGSGEGGSGENGEFSEGFGSGFGSEESGTDGTSGGDQGGFRSFDEGPALDWGGMLRFDTRAFADYDDPEESPISSHPELHLDLDYSASNSEFVANLEFRPEYLEGAEDAVEFAEEIVDEAYLTLFYDAFNIQAGYLKEVWGTGDQVHVVDLLNSNDLRDFVNPDYSERRIARPMFKLNVPVRTQGRFELVYIPTFEPDSIPRSGRWAPAEAAQLQSLIDTALADALITLPAGLTVDELQTVESTLVEPNTSTLEWGQYATRYRDTFGAVDLGLVYYHGFLKQPSVTLTSTGGSPSTFGLGDQILLDYDRVNVFGLEYAAVLAGFNTRGEAAYYLTEDIGGDDPAVTNNSVQYLAGFDRDLPISSLNINIQGVGTYYLNSGEIEDNVEKEMDYDFQYNSDGEYTSHTVSAALTDSYANDKIKPEVAVSYGLENEDWYINPSIEFSLLDDVTLLTEVAIFHGDEGQFGQYDANDFAQVRLQYSY